MIEQTTIVKTIQEMQPAYRVIPQIQNLKLLQVCDSIVVCRVCRGERMVAIKSEVTLTYTYKKCLFCKGSGTMTNKIGAYDGR